MCWGNNMSKNLKIKKEDIKLIVMGMGECIASDMITVVGHEVAYIYRDEPEGDLNGWVFMSGLETQEYTDNGDNFSVYDVNVIANYDESIIPFLKEDVGSEFERDEEGEFQKI